jgi:hypothetical protein
LKAGLAGFVLTMLYPERGAIRLTTHFDVERAGFCLQLIGHWTEFHLR